MSVQAILLPLFVQVLLTFALLLWMASLRGSAIRQGFDLRTIALGEPNWPPRATQVANAFRNQFEVPVLFYVLTVLALYLRKADIVFVVLAWVFVISRLLHAYIHVTSYAVQRRGLAYIVGVLVLLIMWIIFIARILLAL